MEEVRSCQQQLLAHNETIPPKSKVVPFPLSICKQREPEQASGFYWVQNIAFISVSDQWGQGTVNVYSAG